MSAHEQEAVYEIPGPLGGKFSDKAAYDARMQELQNLADRGRELAQKRAGGEWLSQDEAIEAARIAGLSSAC